MILFVSDGRLGNQLFQYAFLKSIAKPKERVVGFRLASINTIFEIEAAHFSMPPLSDRGFRLFQRYLSPALAFASRLKLIGLIEEEKQDGRPNGAIRFRRGLLPFNFVKTAFFQSEALFDHRQVKLEFKQEIKNKAEAQLDKIPEDFEKVFVHVRRGDYLTETYGGKVGIDLPQSYYEKAIQKITAQVAKPFFIFLSDEPDFCSREFSNLEHKIISRNGVGEDLATMSQCAHGIMANSSFSWWGAYLMNHKKNVYYPNYWYGWKLKTHSHPAIYPSFGALIEPE